MEPVSFIDLYCERTAPGFWNEPLNAISNGAFLLAAAWGWADARRHGGPGLAEAALITLAALIGVGSFLFHTFATGWAELADVVPIWTFVVSYVLVIIFRMSGGRFAQTGRIAGIVLVITAAVFWFTGDDVTTEAGPVAVGPFNGSLQYLPALLALVVFAVLAWWQRHPARRWIAAAAVIFLVSLGFRTIDPAICATVPVGSHFLWHILNGVMIGILLSAVIRHMPPVERLTAS